MKLLKSLFIINCSLLILLSACSKPDPILPGVRTPVFGAVAAPVATGEIPEKILIDIGRDALPARPESDRTPRQGVPTSASLSKIYQQTLDNEIYELQKDGTKKKIFSGFPTNGKVNVPRIPIYYKNFVYAGLTTGELIKINPRTMEIAWIADIFKDTDMLGGASVLDIVAPVVIDSDRVFAGGMGGALCSLNISDGAKKWCAEIATATEFLVAKDLLFVVSMDNTLHALDANTGKTYWQAKTKTATAPRLESRDGKILVIVGRQKFDAATGLN
jgi:outer membrane protein assembly factor BamB